jgi:hypothetical protein
MDENKLKLKSEHSSFTQFLWSVYGCATFQSLSVHTNELHMMQVTTETGTGKQREKWLYLMLLSVAKTLQYQWKMNIVRCTGGMTPTGKTQNTWRITCPTSYFVHHKTHMDSP